MVKKTEDKKHLPDDPNWKGKLIRHEEKVEANAAEGGSREARQTRQTRQAVRDEKQRERESAATVFRTTLDMSDSSGTAIGLPHGVQAPQVGRQLVQGPDVRQATEILRDVEQFADALRDIQAKYFSELDMQPPATTRPGRGALDRIEERGPLQMEEPDFPTWVGNAGMAATIAGMVGDVMAAVVGGITGEAVITPTPSTAVMEQTSGMILNEILKHDDLVQRVSEINFQAEMQHDATVIDLLEAFDNRLERWEQTQVMNYFKQKTVEIEHNRAARQDMAALTQMDFAYRFSGRQTMLDAMMKEYGHRTWTSDALFNRDVVNANLALSASKVNLQHAMNVLQLTGSLNRAQASGMFAMDNPQDMANRMATTMGIFGLSGHMRNIEEGVSLLQHPGLYNSQAMQAVDTVVDGITRNAESLYAAVASGGRKAEPGAAKIAGEYVRVVSALANEGYVLNTLQLNQVRDAVEQFYTRESLTPFSTDRVPKRGVIVNNALTKSAVSYDMIEGRAAVTFNPDFLNQLDPSGVVLGLQRDPEGRLISTGYSDTTNMRLGKAAMARFLQKQAVDQASLTNRIISAMSE